MRWESVIRRGWESVLLGCVFSLPIWMVWVAEARASAWMLLVPVVLSGIFAVWGTASAAAVRRAPARADAWGFATDWRTRTPTVFDEAEQFDEFDGQYVIRRGTDADIPGIVRVRMAGFRWAYADLLPAQLLGNFVPADLEAQYRSRPARLERAGKGAPVCVVACDRASGRVIGYAYAGMGLSISHGGEPIDPAIVERYPIDLYELYLVRGARAHGVGAALFRELVAQITARGHRAMRVWVLKENAAGRRFYERMGGVEIPGTDMALSTSGIELREVAYGWTELPTDGATE